MGEEIRTPHLQATRLKPRLARDFNGTLIHRCRLLSRSPLRQRSQPHLKLELQFLDKARLAPSGHPVRARRCARSLLLTKPLPLSSRRRGGAQGGHLFCCTGHGHILCVVKILRLSRLEIGVRGSLTPISPPYAGLSRRTARHYLYSIYILDPTAFGPLTAGVNEKNPLPEPAGFTTTVVKPAAVTNPSLILNCNR